MGLQNKMQQTKRNGNRKRPINDTTHFWQCVNLLTYPKNLHHESWVMNVYSSDITDQIFVPNKSSIWNEFPYKNGKANTLSKI